LCAIGALISAVVVVAKYRIIANGLVKATRLKRSGLQGLLGPRATDPIDLPGRQTITKR
jgi:hypothetical protein